MHLIFSLLNIYFCLTDEYWFYFYCDTTGIIASKPSGMYHLRSPVQSCITMQTVCMELCLYLISLDDIYTVVRKSEFHRGKEYCVIANSFLMCLSVLQLSFFFIPNVRLHRDSMKDNNLMALKFK